MKKLSLFLLLLLLGVTKVHANIFHDFVLAKRIAQTDLLTKNYSKIILPFEFSGGKIYVNIKIEENKRIRDVKLLLDTGAPTILSTKFADNNNISRQKSEKSNALSTPNGVSKAGISLSKNLVFDLSGLKIRKKYTLTRSLSANQNFVCNNVDGILGVDLLQNFTVLFDFQHNEIELINPDSFNASSYGFQSYLEFDNYSFFQKTPWPTLKIGGQKMDVIWDTGYNGDLLMQFQNANSHDALYYLTRDSIQSISTYGTLATIDGKILHETVMYRLGNVPITQNKIKITAPVISFQTNPKLKENRVNLGTGLMSHYVSAIDWKNKKIYLRLTDTFNPVKPLKPICLISYVPEKSRVIIAAVSKESLWYHQGLRTGDNVIAVNGMDVTTLVNTNQSICVINDSIRELNRDIQKIKVNQKGAIISIRK